MMETIQKTWFCRHLFLWSGTRLFLLDLLVKQQTRALEQPSHARFSPIHI